MPTAFLGSSLRNLLAVMEEREAGVECINPSTKVFSGLSRSQKKMLSSKLLTFKGLV